MFTLINPLKTEINLNCSKIYFVPHSKQIRLATETILWMLYREIIALFSENHT
jgi:hypothetical protein